MRIVKLAAAMSFAASVASAQFQQVYEVSVRPGGEARYEALFGKLSEACDRAESPLRWATLSIVAGKAQPTYRIVVPFATWAERDRWADARSLLVSAYGDTEGERIWSEAHESVTGIDSRIWQSLPDSDSNPRDDVANFYEVYEREVRPGTEREIRRLHREFKKAYDAGGPSVTRSVLVYGLNQSLVFRRSSAFDRWEELDDAEARGMLAAHFGADNARAMVDTVRAAAVWTEHFVSALRRDLSRLDDARTPR